MEKVDASACPLQNKTQRAGAASAPALGLIRPGAFRLPSTTVRVTAQNHRYLLFLNEALTLHFRFIGPVV
ncbi:MAG: hypothetical protein D3910_25265 [Candidatus Electrothrix sp. ATG2]|nr:hypothetical protein [Candidatus Electrothrix sp. ATG2]